ncbi:response regulator transcription factor [Paenibacillus hexagrammi]|uniref:Response regulator n=1 Tax=Paenibacillus hexagrammi TaxID=2908839 RepID=A0ABY3SP23_9BACL|nr:response regulator [Paenibacillus sp. YPD9-1]UJF34956.1 response regulator [Paenibacillus sp. YPD9-1]
MRKVLIVDDEKNIRLGLKAMIEREFPGLYEFSFAEDGQEALDKLIGSDIDVVITDIRMPIMDGIALINHIQEFDPKPAVVILSGHDDFQYAKEAIRCDVKDYLLKPIIRDELSRTLLRIEKDLQQKEQVDQQLTNSMQQQEAFQESQFHYLLNHPHLADIELHQKLQQIDMLWLSGGFQLGILKYKGSIEGMGHTELSARIQAELSNVPEPFRYPRAFTFDKENQLVLIAKHRELFQFLAERIAGSGYFAYSMGLSSYGSGSNWLHTAYEEALLALKYTFLQSGPGIIRYENIGQKSKDFAVPMETIKKIANMLGTGRNKEMKTLLLELLDMKTVSRYDISYLEALSQACNEHIFDRVFHIYGGESVEILRLFKKVGDIHHFHFFHDYFHSIEGLLYRLNEYVSTVKSFSIDHKEMKKAVLFMQENYHKDLNMTIVSNYVSLNYSYFSQAFKEYTGDSFVNYLKKLRIDKAKELLETTDLKVYEISEKSGFENTKHFSRVFKEMEGVTPQEYREQREVMR